MFFCCSLESSPIDGGSRWRRLPLFRRTWIQRSLQEINVVLEWTNNKRKNLPYPHLVYGLLAQRCMPWPILYLLAQRCPTCDTLNKWNYSSAFLIKVCVVSLYVCVVCPAARNALRFTSPARSANIGHSVRSCITWDGRRNALARVEHLKRLVIAGGVQLNERGHDTAIPTMFHHALKLLWGACSEACSSRQEFLEHCKNTNT